MKKRTYEIGLVMAGAVSAGAYTAGVVDFLLEALQKWEQARQKGEDVAPHEVKLKVISGASAGGMTAAMIAALVNQDITHITSLPGREPAKEEIENNNLYRSWVDQVDITGFLEDNDLKDSKNRVTSLLDSTLLDRIAESALRFSPNGNGDRHYISDPLHVYLTVTNLQGVPYNIDFVGRSGKGHSVAQHTDYIHFALTKKDPGTGEAEWLNPSDPDQPNWELLKQAALATGAFPGGLAPRPISRRFDHYEVRSWPIPQRPGEGDTSVECTKMVNIKPSWPQEKNGRELHFLSVDGGVMDNEPLELARRALAGHEGFNPREGERARRSVIMIDPFPSEKRSDFKTVEELQEYDIINTLSGLFGSLISQARFKPDELMLAHTDDVYSRFLIAPTRYDSNKNKAKYPIASGLLNGFGGFLSKKFRMHDFQLGRRNCQQFLRRYFVVPVDKARKNPVFADYTEPDFRKFADVKNGESYIPLIPLIGSLQKEVFPLRWNTLALKPSEIEELRHAVHFRTKVVINRLIEQYIDGGFTKTAAKLGARVKRRKIVDGIMNKITAQLEDYELKR